MSSPLLPSADSDRNLLFGVLALQADLIDASQFVEACTVWAARKSAPLADVLIQRGWISESDRHDVERLFERKLKKHGNDARASLLDACDVVRQSLAAFTESQVTGSTPISTDTPNGDPRLPTGPYVPPSRDRYRLEYVHASGGIGRVWRARDGEIGRAVALKELRPDRRDKAGYSDRFIREAQITGQLEHPAIVPVYELNRRAENGQPFYVMRFIRGRTLSQAVDDYHQGTARRTVDFRKLLTAFVEVCNAIGYAHARGVVHRDLKGNNVVLGDFGEVIVLDWGLAKMVGKPDATRDESLIQVPDDPVQETQAGVVVGTPGYMAPEQAEGQGDKVGPLSDIYGLGAILYEILTGQPPHTGSDRHEILRKAREEAPPAPRSIWRRTPPALEAVCLRALEREPADRYASALELAGEVEHWLADEPVQAWPEPLSVRAGRWARRNRPLLAGVAALLLTAVVSLGINNVLLGREQQRTEKEKRRAEDALVLANINFTEMERQRALAEGSARSEKTAHEATDLARQRAVQNLRKACDSVDHMLTRVSEDPTLLANEPRMEQIRRRLLQDALDYYKEFLEEYANDAELRRETVRAARRAANILQELGKHAEASPIYSQAIVLCRKLVDEFPKDGTFLQELAGLHNSVGILHQARGEFVEAAKAYDNALEIKRRLAETYDDVPEFTQELANSLHNRARLYRLLGQTQHALAALDQAIRLRRPLIELFPRQPSYRLNLGRDLIVVGNLLEDAGADREEEIVLRQALELHVALANDYPGVAEYRQALALNRLNLGIRLRKNGNPDEALTEFNESLKIRAEVARDFPGVPNYRSELARVHGSIGLALLDQKKLAEAVKALEEGVEIQKRLVADYPRVPDYRSQLSTGQIQLGFVLSHSTDRKRADEVFRAGLEVAQKLVEEFPDVPSHRHRLAILYVDIAAGLINTNDFTAARLYLEQGLSSNREALRIQPGHHPSRQTFRHQLRFYAEVLEKLKDHAALATTANEWQQAFPDEVDDAYQAARCLGMAAGLAGRDKLLPMEKRREAADRHAKHAVESLLNAVKLGFTNGALLKNESAFDSIRDRADFKNLAAKLAKQE